MLASFMISLSDRYVFLEWFKIFFLAIGTVFGLQMIVEFQDSFGDLLTFDASIGQMFAYFFYEGLRFLNISMPAAILVSILYELGLLHRNNEFLALRVAGMSVFRITRPVWIAGVGLSLLLWTLNASLIPWASIASKKLWDDLEFAHQAATLEEGEQDQVGLVYNLSFDNRKEHRLWFMNSYSKYNQAGYGVRLSIMDENRRMTRLIVADLGYMDSVTGYWRFSNGRDVTIDPESGRPLRFQKIPEGFVLEGVDDDPELMMLFGERPKDLSYLELKRITDNFTRDENPKVLDYSIRLHALVASAASCLIVAGLAIPFAVSGVRVNPAVGVSKSIALFIGYYILVSVLNALAKQDFDFLSPVVAAWVPNVFMIILAIVLIRRVR